MFCTTSNRHEIISKHCFYSYSYLVIKRLDNDDLIDRQAFIYFSMNRSIDQFVIKNKSFFSSVFDIYASIDLSVRPSVCLLSSITFPVVIKAQHLEIEWCLLCLNRPVVFLQSYSHLQWKQICSIFIFFLLHIDWLFDIQLRSNASTINILTLEKQSKFVLLHIFWNQICISRKWIASRCLNHCYAFVEFSLS